MKTMISLATVLFLSAAAQAAPTPSQTLPAAAGSLVQVRSNDRSGVDAVGEAYSTNAYTIRFERGDWVEIWGQGDGDTDLDLFVFDPSGQRVAADEGLTDEMMVGFRARRSGTYQIEVKNLGDVWNAFRLTVEH